MPSAPEPSPTNAATPSSPAPTTTPTPAPDAAPLVISDCETMLPLAAARALCDGTSLSLTGAVAHSALTAIRAANPTLGL